MIRAHVSMTSEEFIDQLRAFAIAFGCGSLVIDKIDELTAALTDDEIESLKEKAKDEGYNEASEEIANFIDDNPDASRGEILQYVKDTSVRS